MSLCRTIHIPFPTHRLAEAALRSLAVDQELSALVQRDFSLVFTAGDGHQSASESSNQNQATGQLTEQISEVSLPDGARSVLQVHYKATTPRMLRVAVNGFFESLGVIVQVMEELDVDVLHEKGIDGLEGVQGVEQGLTGTAVGTGA